ncbi:MAG: 1-acyl-sn-glycerol-3-phosphate acyltransferase [Spirochaetales bacterium]|nr:1-acyl-sn-glycerol-3-phosphate acyltransferase [Spirochaetales bacterium]
MIKNINEPVIVALNHNNYIETLIIAALLVFLRNSAKIHFVVDWMFQYVPVVGWLISHIDPVYAYSKPGKYKFMEKRKCEEKGMVIERCLSLLALGHSIGIFPEGTRNANPKRLKKAKTGIGHLVMKSGVRVVPIGLCYSNIRRKKRISNIDRVKIRIGDPIDFSEELALKHAETECRFLRENEKNIITRYLRNKITYRIMKMISDLSGKEYPYREEAPPSSLRRII